jgi:hypothetical protein
METFKGSPMPPEAAAKMQSAMAQARSKAQEPHAGTTDPGQAANQGQAAGGGQAGAQGTIDAAKNNAQQNKAPN